MLRIYKYTSPYQFKDFETHLFNTLRPSFDYANDKLIVGGIEYRISTINYIGLFNKLLDNQPSYTVTFGQDTETYAVIDNDNDFSVIVNPKLSGCLITLKIIKKTANDIILSLPSGSFGNGIVNNQITLSGLIDSTFILQAIYENSEYDWTSRDRFSGFGSKDEYTAKGYSVTLNKNVDVIGKDAALDTLFNIQAQAPLISLTANPVNTLREFGNNVPSVILSANTTKKTNPILSVYFERNGSLLHQVLIPSANGGTEVFTENNPIAINTTFRAVVSDGTLTGSSSLTFNFVYPFYWGVGAKALTALQIQALTKAIETKANKVVITSPTSQVYYFAFPKSYGLLTSILDKNGFETISGYTLTEKTFTMLDGTTQAYYVYEFNSITTQTNFTNTYKF